MQRNLGSQGERFFTVRDRSVEKRAANAGQRPTHSGPLEPERQQIRTAQRRTASAVFARPALDAPAQLDLSAPVAG